MPLQNRVTPFGEIVRSPARGTLVGNRGVIHDERKEIVRSSALRRWICCVLEWKGIRRAVMTPRRWTELFFLDEATAFAAGHRPCFECRRGAALAYQAGWERAFGKKLRAGEMDLALDADRRRPDRSKRTYRADVGALPEGAFVVSGGAPWLLHRGWRWRWTPAGYEDSEARGAGEVEVLTPRATVEVLRAGYVVGTHASAEGACGS